MAQDLRRVAELYSTSAREHGRNPMGVGWRDEETHLLRFAKLCSVLTDADGPVTVNDLGCGYGALYTYIADTLGLAVERFYGYDISEDMLAMAREAVPAPEAEFIASERVLHNAEYAFASGIFNVRFDTPVEEWEAHAHKVLDDLHAHATRGFAFNMLSTFVDYREDHLYYGDPMQYFQYCKAHYSPYVSLLHDYPLYEWTIVVRHAPPPSGP